MFYILSGYKNQWQRVQKSSIILVLNRILHFVMRVFHKRRANILSLYRVIGILGSDWMKN